VTGGGLSPDGTRWISVKGEGRFLFPVAVIRALFRGKLLAALTRARELGQLDFDGACADLADLAAFARWEGRALQQGTGSSTASRPSAAPSKSSTTSAAIPTASASPTSACAASTIAASPSLPRTAPPSRSHLTNSSAASCFTSCHAASSKSATSGLLAPANVNGKLALARRLLDTAPHPRASLVAAPAIAALVALAANTGEPPPAPAWRDLFRQLTGVDLGRCRVCGQGNVVRLPLPLATAQPPATLDTS
jgi:hypothetical protein